MGRFNDLYKSDNEKMVDALHSIARAITSLEETLHADNKRMEERAERSNHLAQFIAEQNERGNIIAEQMKEQWLAHQPKEGSEET